MWQSFKKKTNVSTRLILQPCVEPQYSSTPWEKSGDLISAEGERNYFWTSGTMKDPDWTLKECLQNV